MTTDEIRKSKRPYAIHIANILDYYSVTDEEIIRQAFDWWLREGSTKYVEIKAKHNSDKEKVFKESGALAKEKLIEFGAEL